MLVAKCWLHWPYQGTLYQTAFMKGFIRESEKEYSIKLAFKGHCWARNLWLSNGRTSWTKLRRRSGGTRNATGSLIEVGVGGEAREIRILTIVQRNVRTSEVAAKTPNGYRNISPLSWRLAIKHLLVECAVIARWNYSAGYGFVEVSISPVEITAWFSRDR